MIDEIRKNKSDQDIDITEEERISRKTVEEFWKDIVADYSKNKNCPEAEAIEHYNTKIKATIPVSSIDKLKFTVLSLYQAITLPMEQVKTNWFVSMFVVRPLQVLASLILVPVAAIGELAQLATEGIAYFGSGLGSCLYYSVLAVLNLPLEFYDFVKNVIDAFSEKTELAISGGVWLLPTGKEPDSSSELEVQAEDDMDMDKEPVHFYSPISSRTSPASCTSNSTEDDEVNNSPISPA